MTTLQEILHFVSPATILTVYLASSLWETISAAGTKTVDPIESFNSRHAADPDDNPNAGKEILVPRYELLKRSVQLFLSLLTGLLYIGEAIALPYAPTAVQRINKRVDNSADGNVVFALFSFLIWLILLLGLLNVGTGSKGRSFFTTWRLALVFELINFGVDLSVQRPSERIDHVRVAQVAVQSLRVVTELALVLSESKWILRFVQESASDEEQAPLLVASTATTGKTVDVDAEADDSNAVRKNWWLYVRRYRLFLPIMRPEKLQDYGSILIVCLCVGGGRVLNVAAPVVLGTIVSSLGADNQVPWTQICLFTGLTMLESNAGIHLLQEQMWRPVSYAATTRLKRVSYDKLMSLSCDFHDKIKPELTIQTMQRGAQIVELVEIIFFQLLPMAADLFISIVIFTYLFNGYLGFVVGLVMIAYVSTTVKCISFRAKLWREYIEVWESEYYAMTESVKGWTTVSHFGRIPYETNNFRAKTEITRGVRMRSTRLSGFTSASKDIILNGGLAAGMFLVARQVVSGDLDVGKFVIFITYWGQLSTPLQYFAAGFDSISKGLVDAEKLLSLYEEKPTIRSPEEAVPLVLKKGAVDFQNVTFSYDGKRVVTDSVTFHASPGKTVAFVGETGCGKSTLLKLIFRFYDPKEGRICIDGQDIRNFTLDSIREHLGIVSQDPILFNQSIRENLRYPNLSATDEQIEEACKAVSLHEKITSFTKGYNEIIGERGTKLSGGERQRLAIARAILKDPRILLLDEATSSVDSNTEAQIQASLKVLCANRTTFIIAHRLSTIVNADQIIVMDNGKIVESGTHSLLIKQQGPYKKLWTSQRLDQIKEVRGRSSSRPKSQDEDLMEDEHSDEEQTVTTVPTKGEMKATAHEVLHKHQRERGHDVSENTPTSPNGVPRSKMASPPSLNTGLVNTNEGSTLLDISQTSSHVKVRQAEGKRDEDAEGSHDSLKVPHGAAEAARRRNQSASEPLNSDDDDCVAGQEIDSERPGLRSKALHASGKRNITHTGLPNAMTGLTEPTPPNTSEQTKARQNPRFKLRNGKISAGLQSVVAGQASESSVEDFVTDETTGPVLKAPVNTPAGELSPRSGKSDPTSSSNSTKP